MEIISERVIKHSSEWRYLKKNKKKNNSVSKNTHVCVWTRPRFKDDTLMGINQLDHLV